MAVAAKVLHREDKLGAISPDMVAGLVMAEDDPTRAISAMQWVRVVLKGGVLRESVVR